jgi:hypothetical protein
MKSSRNTMIDTSLLILLALCEVVFHILNNLH